MKVVIAIWAVVTLLVAVLRCIVAIEVGASLWSFFYGACFGALVCAFYMGWDEIKALVRKAAA